MRTMLWETFGTALLVGLGTAAIAWDALHGGLGVAGIALGFGAAVGIAVTAALRGSGAHLNPAVTLALATARRFSWRDVPRYIAAQSVGAILGAWAVTRTFGGPHGATVPSIAVPLAAVVEAAATLLLVGAVLLLVLAPARLRVWIPPSVAAVVALNAWWAGPLTGASMNPARSLGPALAGGPADVLWLYLLVPSLVGLAAGYGARLVMRHAVPEAST